MQFPARLEKIRTKLRLKQASQEGVSRMFSTYFKWLEIYAVLGQPDLGATLEEISVKTGLSPAKCQTVLAEMVDQHLVRIGAEGRFIANQSHLSFSGFGGDDFVGHYFRESLRDVARWVEADFKSTKKLFSNSVVSIDSRRAAEFKEELRDLVDRFAERAEDPNGDRLDRLVVAFGMLG